MNLISNKTEFYKINIDFLFIFYTQRMIDEKKKIKSILIK